MLKDEFLELRRRIIAKDFSKMNDGAPAKSHALKWPHNAILCHILYVFPTHIQDTFLHLLLLFLVVLLF